MSMVKPRRAIKAKAVKTRAKPRKLTAAAPESPQSVSGWYDTDEDRDAVDPTRIVLRGFAEPGVMP